MKRGFLNNTLRPVGATTAELRRGLTSTKLPPSDRSSPDLQLSQSTRGKKSILEDFTPVGGPPAKSPAASKPVPSLGRPSVTQRCASPGLFGPSPGDGVDEVVPPTNHLEPESGYRKMCAENQPSDELHKGKNVSMSNKVPSVNCAEVGNRKAGITKLKEWFQERMRENKLIEVKKEEHSSCVRCPSSHLHHNTVQMQETLLVKQKETSLGGGLPTSTDPIEDNGGEDWSATVPARNRKLKTKHPQRVRKVVQPQDELQQKIGDQRGILGKHPPLIYPQAAPQVLGDRKKTRYVKTLKLMKKVPHQDLEQDMAICTKMGNKDPATSYELEKHRSEGRAKCEKHRSPTVPIYNRSNCKPFDPGDKSSAHPLKPGETMVDQVMSESDRMSYSRNDLLALRFGSPLSADLRVACKQVHDELGFSQGRQWPSSFPGHSTHLVAYVNQRTKQVGFIERHPSLSIHHHESRDGNCSGPTTFKLLCSKKRKINCVLSSRTISEDHHLPPSEDIHNMFVHAEVLQEQSPLPDVQDVSTDIRERGTCISTKRTRSWLHPKQLGRSVRRCSGLTQKRNSIMVDSSKPHQSIARPFSLPRKRKLISEDSFVVVKVPKLEVPFRPVRHCLDSLDLEVHFGVPEIVPQQSPQPP